MYNIVRYTGSLIATACSGDGVPFRLSSLDSLERLICPREDGACGSAGA
ncbi:MAG: hypothetical protein LBS92_01635 [Candidatus Methanoplasma sp.]|nr:hypothetical protein [Candidatus Methanoplasma sp.]